MTVNFPDAVLAAARRTPTDGQTVLQRTIAHLWVETHRTLGLDPDGPHGLYDPSNKRDKAAQAMEAAARAPGRGYGDDRDADYRTVPKVHVMSSDRSDATYRAAERGWHDTTDTLSLVAHLVTEWAATVTDERVVVRGRSGSPTEPPDTVWTETASGREIVDVPPADTSRWLWWACEWMWWAAATLDSHDPSHGVVQRAIRMDNLRWRTSWTLDRIVRRPERPRPAAVRCLNPAGVINHPRGDDATVGVCRRCNDGLWHCGTCGTELKGEDLRRNRRQCGKCRKAKSRADAGFWVGPNEKFIPAHDHRDRSPDD